LSFLANRELEQNSSLVTVLKSGQKKVYKKDVRKKYERRRTSKQVIVEVTRDNPEILEAFRAAKRSDFSRPLELNALAARAHAAPPNWDKLLKDVTKLAPGPKDAKKYHDAIEALLSALLYPSLVEPRKEKEIDEGIKRIDIRYINMATEGFFRWYQQQFGKAPYVPVECKNYKEDPKNPELAQLVSRFSDQRGRLGFLVCREIKDRPLFVKRCQKELANNGNYVIGIDDEDLKVLVQARKTGDEMEVFSAIRQRFDEVID
jgi:hypothetical protein